MKTVAIIPIKKKSQRVPGKNFKKIRGKALYEYTLEKVKKCNFDEIFVDSDSPTIKEYCKKNNLKFINRIPKLAENS